MTGKTIVITSGKGGVGKTTATANIGTGLAMRGHRVVVVDTDIGRVRVTSRPGMHGVVSGVLLED